MMHNENVYPDPFLFRPERFLGVSENTTSGFPYHPSAYVFGFGRRYDQMSEEIAPDK
jgi:cytochrome P450